MKNRSTLQRVVALRLRMVIVYLASVVALLACGRFV